MKGCLIVAAISSLLAACSPFNKAAADRHVSPIVSAVEEFREANGSLPESLDSLQASLPQEKKLKLSHDSDSGRRWSISYELSDPGNYTLRFNHVHYDVIYRNGERGTYSGSYFR